jgi:hypothetical protein
VFVRVAFDQTNTVSVTVTQTATVSRKHHQLAVGDCFDDWDADRSDVSLELSTVVVSTTT